MRGRCPDLSVIAYYVPSLKTPGVADLLREEFKRNPPDVIVNTTAFSARGEDTALAARRCGLPRHSSRHGRAAPKRRGENPRARCPRPILPCTSCCRRSTGACLRARSRSRTATPPAPSCHKPHAEASGTSPASPRRGCACGASRVHERKLALVLSTYPGRPDQIAHAVGLDGPASALRIAQHLQGAGYAIEGLPSERRPVA